MPAFCVAWWDLVPLWRGRIHNLNTACLRKEVVRFDTVHVAISYSSVVRILARRLSIKRPQHLHAERALHKKSSRYSSTLKQKETRREQ